MLRCRTLFGGGTDFFSVEVLPLRGLVTYYVLFFVHLESRKVHVAGITVHPNECWMQQMARNVTMDEWGILNRYRYLLHDRDAIFSRRLDSSIKALGMKVLRSPIASPKANAICERVIGTIRRECLDWMIPMSAGHLRAILLERVKHYNEGRPHRSLGPGVPDPPRELTVRHIPAGHNFRPTPDHAHSDSAGCDRDGGQSDVNITQNAGAMLNSARPPPRLI